MVNCVTLSNIFLFCYYVYTFNIKKLPIFTFCGQKAQDYWNRENFMLGSFNENISVLSNFKALLTIFIIYFLFYVYVYALNTKKLPIFIFLWPESKGLLELGKFYV